MPETQCRVGIDAHHTWLTISQFTKNTLTLLRSKAQTVHCTPLPYRRFWMRQKVKKPMFLMAFAQLAEQLSCQKAMAICSSGTSRFDCTAMSNCRVCVFRQNRSSITFLMPTGHGRYSIAAL